MSQKKQLLTAAVSAKKAAAGRKGKGVDAFVPRKTKKVDALQERIDKLVKEIKAKEAAGIEQHDGGDVMRDRLNVFRGRRVCGSKL